MSATLLEIAEIDLPVSTVNSKFSEVDDRLTSRHVEDGSFLRISTISLKYRLYGSSLKKSFFNILPFNKFIKLKKFIHHN